MSNAVALPAVTVEHEDEEEADHEIAGDHSWTYRYNRRLSCFSHSVASLTFSLDGKWLVSATKSGHVKIFDTEYWAERAKLQGCRNEEPRCIAISPAQRWLVCMYPSVMHIFDCKPPWGLVTRLPSPLDPATKATSEWCCVAFSPMSEVDHPGGHAGQDNHLAAFASKTLCVLDYSGGWEDIPKRTACILNEQRPTSIAYTACGWWLVCGYASGQLQIWNHFSLTLERTLFGHNGAVACITTSPRCAPYDSRFISCGVDSSLRVWHTHGWILEQIVPDTRADRNGIFSCMFSGGGDWVVSVSVEMCVWRVCITRKGKLELRLHQRLSAVCGAESLCTASICCRHDAIAVGSRDGVLGLWTKTAGWPEERVPRFKENEWPVDLKRERVGASPWITDTPAPRPMFGVRPEGMRSVGLASKEPALSELSEKRYLRNSEFFLQTNLRSLSGTNLLDRPALNASNSHDTRTRTHAMTRTLHLPVPGNLAGLNRVSNGDRAMGRTRADNGDTQWSAPKCYSTGEQRKVTPSPLRTSMQMSSAIRTKLPDPNVQKVSAFGMEAVAAEEKRDMKQSNSMPELKRWKSTSFDCEGVLGALCGSSTVSVTVKSNLSNKMPPMFGTPGMRNFNSSGRAMTPLNGHGHGELPPLAEEAQSPVRQAIMHATRGLVQRISLDPQQICRADPQ